MTNRTLPQGAEAGFRADLKAQKKQANRAALLLEQAVACLAEDEPGEAHADRAQRMRGAAVLATSAAIELAVTCGWLEAATAAEMNGLTDSEAGVMSAEETRLAVERAIVELHDIDQALSLMTGAIKRRLTTALGKLAEVRDALNADETNGGGS